MSAARVPAEGTRTTVRTAIVLALALLLGAGLLPGGAGAQVTAGAVSIAIAGAGDVAAATPSPLDITVRVTDRGTLRDDTPVRLVGDLGDLGAIAGDVEVAHVRADGSRDVLDVDAGGRFVFPREDRAPLTLGGAPALTTPEGLSIDLSLTMPDVDGVELAVGLFASNERSAAVVRRRGSERIATATAISAATFNPGVPVAYIARADAFPDALAGGLVAGLTAGPVLLTQPGALPAATAAELDRLRPQRIVALGGPGAVREEVMAALAAHTVGTVTRLAGSDRFATAAAIADAHFTAPVDTVVIATGEGFADALSGGPAAATLDAPILLVGRDALPAATAEALQRLAPRAIVVLGGPAAVSDAVTGQLSRYAAEGVSRVAGPTRFETSAAISSRMFRGGASVAYLSTGQTFPDALAGAPAAIVDGAPLLLTARDAIPAAVAAELQRLAPGVVVILGGEGVVAPAVADALTLLTRDVQPDRARFAAVGAPTSATLITGEALAIAPLAPEGPAALRPGDRFALTVTAPAAGAHVVEHRRARTQAWVPFANPTATGTITAGENQVSLNAPVRFGAYDVRVRVSAGGRSQTTVLADAFTVGIRFRPPMFGSLVEGVDDQSQVIAVSPVRGLEEGVRLDADLSDGVRAGVDYSSATLRLLHGTGQARLIRNRVGNPLAGEPGCVLCIEYTAGPGDEHTEGEAPRAAPIIAFRLDGVDAPDIDATLIGRFFRYDDQHGVQWPWSVGTPGAVAGPRLSDLEQGNGHQPQILTFALPGAPGQQALAPGEQVVVDLSEGEQGAVDYADASAFVSGGGHHGVEPTHEPPPGLGEATIEVVEGESAILTFTAGPEGVASMSPEGPIVDIFIGGVAADDEAGVYTATITRSDSPAVSTVDFAVRRAGIVGATAGNLASGRQAQTQVVAATLDGAMAAGEKIIIDLSGPQNGGVDYRRAAVRVTGGTGGARLLTFDEELEGGGAAIIYASGGDADGTSIRFTVTGVDTTAVDESHFAVAFRSDGQQATRAAFDVGAGSPFVSPFVSDLESSSDDTVQIVAVGLASRLAPGQTVQVDLSAAERGGASYGRAFAQVYDIGGSATLAVTAGTSATLTYTAGPEGAPAGSFFFMEIAGIQTGDLAATYPAVFSRSVEARTATASFAIRRVPALGSVSATNLASNAIGQTQTLRATVLQDLRPGEIVQVDLSGAESGAAAYGGAVLSVTGGSGQVTMEAARGGYASIQYRPGPQGDPDGTQFVFELRGVNTVTGNETHVADFARFPDDNGEGFAQKFSYSQRSARFTIGSGGPFIGRPFLSELFAGGVDEFQFVEVRLADDLSAGQQVVIDLNAAQAGAVDYQGARVEGTYANGTATLSATPTTARLTFTAGPGGVRSGRGINVELGGIAVADTAAEYPVRITAPGGSITVPLTVFAGGHGCCDHGGVGFAAVGEPAAQPAPGARPGAYRPSRVLR